MEQEEYQRIRSVLGEASGLEGAARASFLERQDATVRSEVERLLSPDVIATGSLVPPVSVPIPKKLGNYDIVREVGRGGMGTVYEATCGGERFALKVIHPHLAVLPRFFLRFEREARIGQEVVHENVVRTIDVDQDAGMHFLVLEYVEGKTLRALLKEWGTIPETLLREIAKQVAAGLTAIHTAGVVHRDLKPDNVLITKDQRVRIMDMGIAKVWETSANLTEEGEFLGSLHYAAPEQYAGEEIGAPADLYGLGVLLYEMATGDNPFEHVSPGAIVRAHLDVVPESARNVSPFFAQVLATLMAKSPADRFENAGELGRVLAEGEDSDWWTERRQEQWMPPISVRRDAELRGRAGELAALHAAWADARNGQGCAVLLRGEAGLGKTRLVDSFLRSIAGEKAHMLYGSYRPTGGLRGLTDAVTTKFGVAHLEDLLAPYLEPTSSLVPAFASYLRNEGAGAIQTDALKAMLCHLMRALAAEMPTVWVIEDLHFAPEIGQSVARVMARAAAPHRVLLVLTSRKEFPGVAPLNLSRLSETDVIQLVGDEEQGRRIARKSDGVPFFVFELIHAANEGIEDVPSAVRDLIAARLGEVDRHERVILDVASAQGFEFDADLVAAAIERPIVTVLQDLVDIERRLDLVRCVGRVYHFDHHLVQEVLYDELPQRLKEEYHTRLAGAGGDAAFLAFHHTLGRQPERAIPYIDEALDSFEKRFLNEKALGLLERALPIVEGEQRVRLQLRYARRLSMSGDRKRQREEAESALALANDLDDPALRGAARLALGTHFLQIGADNEAREHIDRALELAREAGDAELELQALVRAGTVELNQRRFNDAFDHYEQARVRAKEVGASVSEVVAMTNCGLCRRMMGHLEDARERFERALQVAEERNEPRAISHVEANLGLGLWYLGRLDEAKAHLERRLGLGIEMGDRRAECSATGNLGLVYREKGLWDETLRHFSRHREIAREIGDRRAEAVALGNLGLLYPNLGDAETGMRFSKAALDLCDEIKFVRGRPTALLAVGYCAEHLGESKQAEDAYRDAGRQMEESSDAFGEVLVRLRLARLGSTPDLERAERLAAERNLKGQTVVAAALRGERSPGLEQAGVPDRMESCFLLWKAHGRAEDLEEAQRLLDFVTLHAPEQYRDSLRNHSLHREIHSASR